MIQRVGTVPRLLIGKEYGPEVTRLVGLAERSVVLVSYVTSEIAGRRTAGPAPLFEAIGAAAARGVSCRVLFERQPRSRAGVEAARQASEYLRALSVSVKIGPRSATLHSKFIVLDDVFCVVGSHNLTRRSLERNFEVSVLLGDISVSLRLAQAFDRLWFRSSEK